jgi:hypothetical protein
VDVFRTIILIHIFYFSLVLDALQKPKTVEKNPTQPEVVDRPTQPDNSITGSIIIGNVSRTEIKYMYENNSPENVHTNNCQNQNMTIINMEKSVNEYSLY